MDIKEAEKLSKQKPEQNYMMFTLDYSKHLIVPYKSALKILEGLADAEIFDDGYGNRKGLKPFHPDDHNFMQTKVISATSYQDMRMAQLLNIDLRDITAAREDRELIFTH